jgi:hypothetical protein
VVRVVGVLEMRLGSVQHFPSSKPVTFEDQDRLRTEHTITMRHKAQLGV